MVSEMKTIRILIGSILLLSMLPAVAADTKALMERYRQSLDQQDAEGLKRLISPDASIRLLLEQPEKEPLVLTLTRQEYLQQLRALWRFSETEAYELSDMRAANTNNGESVSFAQHERYQLLGETLNRQSAITLWASDDNDTPLILRIEALTREW